MTARPLIVGHALVEPTREQENVFNDLAMAHASVQVEQASPVGAHAFYATCRDHRGRVVLVQRVYTDGQTVTVEGAG